MSLKLVSGLKAMSCTSRRSGRAAPTVETVREMAPAAGARRLDPGRARVYPCPICTSAFRSQMVQQASLLEGWLGTRGNGAAAAGSCSMRSWRKPTDGVPALSRGSGRNGAAGSPGRGDAQQVAPQSLDTPLTVSGNRAAPPGGREGLHSQGSHMRHKRNIAWGAARAELPRGDEELFPRLVLFAIAQRQCGPGEPLAPWPPAGAAIRPAPRRSASGSTTFSSEQAINLRIRLEPGIEEH